MLPKFLFSTYSQYKADTSAFTTWLGNVAEACGYQPKKEKKLSETEPSNSANVTPEETAKVKAPRLKGKARVEAKKQAQAKANDEPADLGSAAESVRTVKYGLTIQEMLAQVDAVHRSKSQIKMPSGIQKLLERAIDARSRCSAWYEATKFEDSQFDEDGHQYFIKVLQDALSKLRRDSDQGAVSSGSRSGSAKNASSSSKALVDLENRFSLLEVEDVDESFQLSPTEVALTSGKRPAKKQQVDSVDVFELEADRAFDNAFAVFCFFEDLGRVQKQLKETWKNCNAGKVDLITATVATHAAIYMIQTAEKDLVSSAFGDYLLVNDSYRALAGMMAMVETTLTQGVDPLKGGRVDVTPFDNFIFLPAARILFKFAHIAGMSQNDQEIEAKWPAPIPPLQFQYVFHPEKAELPEHKKLQHDDMILTQLLLDLQLPDKCEKWAGKSGFKEEEHQQFRLPQEDIFVRTLRPVWTKRQVTVAQCFTAQLLLDILDASDDPSSFYKHLYYSLRHANASFDFKVHKQSSRGQVLALGTGGGVNWPHSGDGLMLRIHAFMTGLQHPKLPMLKTLQMQVSSTPKMYSWANTTPEQRALLSPAVKELQLQVDNNPEMFKLSPMLTTLQLPLSTTSGMLTKLANTTPEQRWPMDERMHPAIEASMRLDLTFIKPASDHDFIFNHNPLFSGTVMLKLLLDYHEAGLSLANHHQSILVAAHLYNALRQLNMLKEDWPLMEQIIALHKRAIFADVVPTRTEDIADRLAYRLDAHQKQKRHFEDGKYKFKEPESAQIYRSLLDTTERNDRIVWQIENQVRSLANTDDRSSTAVKLKAKAKVVRSAQQLRQLTPECYVSGVQTTFSQTLSDLSIDYIRLTKRCIILLDTFRDEWNKFMRSEGLDLKFDSIREGENSKDISRLAVCYEAFKEAKEVRNMRIYTYRPGDGEVSGVRGKLNDDPDDEKRHGMGLMVASKVMKDFLARKDDFRFPLFVNRDVLAREKTPDLPDKLDSWKIHKVSTPTELHSFFAGNTYVVVNFHTDYAVTRDEMATFIAELAKSHRVPGVLEFVGANKDDMPELTAQYCGASSGHQQNFVFFKEGKQVAVNGCKILRGRDKVGLKAAAEKLGELAKKRAAQAKGE